MAIDHDDLIGGPDGVVVTSTGGVEFLVLRPLLPDFVVSMPRGAAVVYPKDAAQIVTMADIFPGAHVVEAGVGFGRADLHACCGRSARTAGSRRTSAARTSPRSPAGTSGPSSAVTTRRGDSVVGDLATDLDERDVDRIVLDMLAPWECVPVVADALIPGGLVCAYVATTTQLSRFVETLREHEGFTEPESWESLVRGWHVEGLAVRPEHRMNGHTGFLVTARRLAPGVTAPRRSRRPSPGAYGDDYRPVRAARRERPGLTGGDPEVDESQPEVTDSYRHSDAPAKIDVTAQVGSQQRLQWRW